ncbi:MAG: polysaccharide biosynthesis protein [Thermoleophilia bacterium]|nr:polysaccharide biosynthesis protein [Thermoleophilia bacterium]
MYGRILKLASHSAVYGVASVASKIVALLLLPLYTRYLTPTMYGTAEVILTLDLFAAAIARLGLQNAMMRFFYDAPIDERMTTGARNVRAALTVTFLSAIAASGLLVLFRHPLASFFLGDADYTFLIKVAALGLFANIAYSAMTATFRLQQRPTAFLCVSLANIIASTLLTYWFVTGLKWGARGLLLGNFLGFLLLVPVAMAMQKAFVKPLLDWQIIKPMFAFALPTIPMAVAYQSLTLIDRSVIRHEGGGLDALGVYALAARFAGVVMLVVTALQLSWQPFAYSIEDDAEAKHSFAIVTTWFAAVMGWLVAGLALLADPVVKLMAPPDYAEAARVVPLLALGTGIYGAYFLVGIGASRVKRTGWHVLVAFGAVAVSLVANLLLVPWVGVMGAAVSDVLANLALVVFMLLRAQRVFHVDYEVGRILRPVVLTAAAIAAAYLLPVGTGWQSWTSRTLLAFGWPILLVATGFVRSEERLRIVRLLKRQRGPVDGPGGAGGGAVGIA